MRLTYNRLTNQDSRLRNKWQARRDSNPQHPVLETGALPIRATGLQLCSYPLFCFFVGGMLTTKTTIFAEFQLLRSNLFILCCGVVSLLTLGASKGNDVSHRSSFSDASRALATFTADSARWHILYLYSIIALTTPAPTVRPPSRMAKRRPSSMAIGVIRFTVIATLSPGITISVPAGNSATPVTSVVRK